jgi:hypothetical protein
VKRKNLDILAGLLADHLGKEFPAESREAIPLSTLGQVLAFATDGFGQDSRSRRGVELMRKGLRREGFSVLGFGVSSLDGRTWAMIVEADAENPEVCDLIHSLLWSSREQADAEYEAIDPEFAESQRNLLEDAIGDIEWG